MNRKKSSGVGNGNRTRNRRSHSPVLYQLSYSHRQVDYTTALRRCQKSRNQPLAALGMLLGKSRSDGKLYFCDRRRNCTLRLAGGRRHFGIAQAHAELDAFKLRHAVVEAAVGVCRFGPGQRPVQNFRFSCDG